MYIGDSAIKRHTIFLEGKEEKNFSGQASRAPSKRQTELDKNKFLETLDMNADFLDGYL